MTTNPNQALWEKGDFTQVAGFMRDSGAALVRGLDIRPGMKVLDVGCGDGTTALPMAMLGAEVLGVDIARNLVAAGNARAQAAGLSHCRFQHGDAAILEGIADRSMDLVVSIFGAMFAPKPFEVAKAFVRVTKPGGRIVMGNWIPNDPTFVAQVLKISSAYSPPPPEGFISPMTWGVPDHVVERFTAAGVPAAQIACVPETYTFRADLAPSAFVDIFRRYYGPTMNAFDAAAQNGKTEELHDKLVALATQENVSGQTNVTIINATFLKVTVTV